MPSSRSVAYSCPPIPTNLRLVIEPLHGSGLGNSVLEEIQRIVDEAAQTY